MRTAWGREDHMEEHDGDPLNNQQTGLLVGSSCAIPKSEVCAYVRRTGPSLSPF